MNIIQKSGAWFSYKENRLAQGRDNTKEMIKNDPALMQELETLVRANLDKLNPSARVAPLPSTPVEIPLEAAAKVSAPAAKAKIDISVDD